MRRSLPALLAFALALPAAAQSQYADSAGTYVSVGGFPISYGGSGLGLQLGTSVEVGRRFGNGFDAGLTGSLVTYGTRATSWSVGAAAGLSRPAPLGTVARLQAAASYGGLSYDYTGLQLRSTSVRGDVSATVGRSVPLVGTLRLRPAVGVYGAVSQRLSLDNPSDLRAGAATRVDGGVQVEVPLTFRLFGKDAAVIGRYRVSGWGDVGLYGEGNYPGGGFRLNF